MGESLFVAGFVLTRDDWDALGKDGREEILRTLTRTARGAGTRARTAGSASKVEPLPLPPV